LDKKTKNEKVSHLKQSISSANMQVWFMV